MKPSKALRESFEPVNPGAFMPDGSFKEDALFAERGPMDALVRSLVRQRQAGRVTPSEAVSLIRSAHAEHAFPYVVQWDTATDWRSVWASTSAEDVVRRAGGGAG